MLPWKKMQLSVQTRCSPPLNKVKRCKVPIVTVCISERWSRKVLKSKPGNFHQVVLRHRHTISRKGSSELWWERKQFFTKISLAHWLVDKFKHLVLGEALQGIHFQIYSQLHVIPSAVTAIFSFSSSPPPPLPFLFFLPVILLPFILFFLLLLLPFLYLYTL